VDLYGLVGQVLDGQFRVDRPIGEGGFSVVYAGMHIGLDEPVAIKCLKLQSQLGSAVVEGFIRRFRDESKIHYRLSRGSLHIARTIAAGTTMAPATGALVPYMVLEWLEGYTLSEELRARRQRGETGRSMQEVLRLLDPVADAMAFAHAQGVVHRDLNPSNIFVAHAHGTTKLKVLDFGVAKVISDHALALGPRAQTIGQIRMFTPAYAAPEQFHEALGPIGPQTDVYSFAVLVVELLADRTPIEGDHIGEYADRALDPERRPTPRSMGVQVGDAVEAVIAKAVTVDPSQRPSDVGEFWGMLKNAANRDAQQFRAGGVQAGFPKPPIDAAPSARAMYAPRVTAGKLPVPEGDVSVYSPSAHRPSKPPTADRSDPPEAPPTAQQLPPKDAPRGLSESASKPPGAGRYGYYSSRPPPPRWDSATPPPQEVVESLRAPRVPREATPAPVNKTLGSAALSEARTSAVQQAAQEPSRSGGPVRKATLMQGSFSTGLDGQAPAPIPTPTPSPYVVPIVTPPPVASVPVASTLSSALGAAAAAQAKSPQPPKGTAFEATVAAPIVTPAPSPIVTPPPAPAGRLPSSPNLGDTAQSAMPLRTPPPAPAPVWQQVSVPEVAPPPPWQRSQRPLAAQTEKKSNVPLLVAIALALTVMLVVVAIVANQLAR
jgi:serine/threonine-protein kinase